MKTKIAEVQDYFKDKILSGDFKITEVGEYVIKITVDDEYRFSLWIGNWDIKDNMKCYDGYYNFMMIPFTQEESIQLKNRLTPEVSNYRRNVLLVEKRKELEKLENEISIS